MYDNAIMRKELNIYACFPDTVDPRQPKQKKAE
jgi:hypothetical protein